MSAPRGTGRSVEVKLKGYVTLQEVCAQVAEIWRRARQEPGLLFALNCSAVVDFSTLALTALGRLRSHLREFGCDLDLVRCSESVLERKDDALLTSLLTYQLPPTEEASPAAAPSVNRLASRTTRQDSSHDPQVPHYLSSLVKTYQRFWLN
jgi:anti-anti-sigma regulatory factor